MTARHLVLACSWHACAKTGRKLGQNRRHFRGRISNHSSPNPWVVMCTHQVAVTTSGAFPDTAAERYALYWSSWLLDRAVECRRTSGEDRFCCRSFSGSPSALLTGALISNQSRDNNKASPRCSLLYEANKNSTIYLPYMYTFQGKVCSSQ